MGLVLQQNKNLTAVLDAIQLIRLSRSVEAQLYIDLLKKEPVLLPLTIILLLVHIPPRQRR